MIFICHHCMVLTVNYPSEYIIGECRVHHWWMSEYIIGELWVSINSQLNSSWKMKTVDYQHKIMPVIYIANNTQYKSNYSEKYYPFTIFFSIISMYQSLVNNIIYWLILIIFNIIIIICFYLQKYLFPNARNTAMNNHGSMFPKESVVYYLTT